MAKYSINLLQPDLLPAKALWTLNRVVGLWGAVLALMLVLILWVQWQVTTASTELQVAQSLNSRQQLQLQNLEAVIAENRTDAALLSQLNVIKLVIANKQHLHQQLTDPKQTYSAGFSSAMAELAALHNKNISLEKVNIGPGSMTFSGIARTPDAVPNWLSGFESSTFLSGQRFLSFSLTENERKLTEFVVSSARQGE
ncbi:Fimbrial assembly protein (PilN) [Colwellia chukchiensis]|uniref:Fimbrial assembly protein (PilN) n=3 Tax=Colwellia chukchiensis TaxID=641665 RepID=A0A1H7LBY7_9GAMM|nr:PilN domain-containing protein [Colwellia chukchiensis]SEK96290.1 Fimbrial assembly protein (PilN) [Colwellia chukchiensis]